MAHNVVAIPLFGEEVAPRFCFAREFLLAELAEGGVVRRERMDMADLDWPERLERLAEAGVTVVLCAGIGRRFVPSAEVRGIQVVNCLSGRAEDLIEAYSNGNLEDFRFPRRAEAGPCGGAGRGRFRARDEKQEGRR